MNCGLCDKTDGMCYTSQPPQVKCTVTGEFHLFSDKCNVIELFQRVKEERDAAVQDLQLIADRGVLCVACKHRDPAQEDPLSGCPIDGTCTYNGKKWSPNFVWRGPKQETDTIPRERRDG